MTRPTDDGGTLTGDGRAMAGRWDFVLSGTALLEGLKRDRRWLSFWGKREGEDMMVLRMSCGEKLTSGV